MIEDARTAAIPDDAPADDSAAMIREMIASHEAERADLLTRLGDLERRRDRAAVEAIQEDAAARIAARIEAARQRIRGDRAAGTLTMFVRIGRPSEARLLDEIAAEAAPDAMPVVVIAPRPDAFGRQDRRAWAFIEVSADVWR